MLDSNAELFKLNKDIEDIEFINTAIISSYSYSNVAKEYPDFPSFSDMEEIKRNRERDEKDYADFLADFLSKNRVFLENRERMPEIIKHYQGLEKTFKGIDRGTKVRIIRKNSYWFNQIGTVITAELENRELYYGISVRFDNVNYSGLTSNNYCLEDLELV